MSNLAVSLVENYPVPSGIIRYGIRKQLKERLRRESSNQQTEELIAAYQQGPISTASDEANEQHYELPAEFFQQVLGPKLKYSSCTFPDESATLAEAEDNSILEIIDRAEITSGQNILELGCGWGSFSLNAAAAFPESNFTAVSNSSIQRIHIEAQMEQRGIKNLNVITCDINQLEFDQKFDRIVSVEMFEHLRNHQLLFSKIADWLEEEGKLFVHIFCHKQYTYFFDEAREDEWMAKYFFTGGIMPAKDYFHRFDQDLKIVKQWDVSGRNYEKTANAWADNLLARKSEVMPILEAAYGKAEAYRWFRRWLMFFLACAELFGYRDGEEWLVNHYLFEKVEK